MSTIYKKDSTESVEIRLKVERMQKTSSFLWLANVLHAGRFLQNIREDSDLLPFPATAIYGKVTDSLSCTIFLNPNSQVYPHRLTTLASSKGGGQKGGIRSCGISIWAGK